VIPATEAAEYAPQRPSTGLGFQEHLGDFPRSGDARVPGDRVAASDSPIETMLAEILTSPLANRELMHQMGFFMKPSIEAYDDEHAWLCFTFRSTSWDFPGERSDIHDLIPSEIASRYADVITVVDTR